MQETTFVANRSKYREESTVSSWLPRFISCIESFPTPANKSRALYLYLRGPNSDISRAAELIGLDPPLSVEVIRSASPSSSFEGGYSELRDAVATIGLEKLSRIALRIWLKNFLPRSLSLYCLDGGEFIQRSVACGAAMRYIYQGDSRLEETAYAVGLLHAIGRIVIDETVRRHSNEEDIKFCERTSRELSKAEALEFGVTHAEIGALALKYWGFPKEIYDPVENQYSNSYDDSGADWMQSLSIARFTADRVLEFLYGSELPLKGEGRVVYRKKSLTDIFEFTHAMLEQDILADCS